MFFSPFHTFINTLQSIAFCRRASVLPIAGAAFFALVFAAGGAVDYASLTRAKMELQVAADTAALSAAKELKFSKANIAQVETIGRDVALASLDNPGSGKAEAQVSEYRDAVTVTVKMEVKGSILASIGGGDSMSASATARILGGSNLCVVALGERLPGIISTVRSARITAPGCTIYSNSKSNSGIIASGTARVFTDVLCSAGGARGTGTNFQPKPVLDCPQIDDPLGHRTKPEIGSCDHNSLIILGAEGNLSFSQRLATRFDRNARIVRIRDDDEDDDGEDDDENEGDVDAGVGVENGRVTLSPGTYCGGLVIGGDIEVTFEPGIYAFLRGQLVVENGATLIGENVGLYFEGFGAYLYFAPSTTIDLSAPTSGPMAGMLLWEDADIPVGGAHIIRSNNARRLLGTIYMPKGFLNIASNGDVAEQSEYTAIIARQIVVGQSANLVLNTDYDLTDVPVPDGVGPMDGNVALSE